MSRIVVIDGWADGSHQQWIDGYCRHSAHEIIPITHPGTHWRWRLQGAAVTLADAFARTVAETGPIDVCVVASTVDIASFAGLARKALGEARLVAWFHENQLTYPRTTHQRRDPWPEWSNWKSALAADSIVFNSPFHKRAFLDAVPRLLGRAPDELHDHLFVDVVERSDVLPVGTELGALLSARKPERSVPLVVWNHRWDDDKAPRIAMESLARLAEDDVAFEVALLGEDRHFLGDARAQALRWLGDRVVVAGHLPEEEYREVLVESNVCVSTAEQEFFGVATAEAVAAGCVPVVPNRLAYPDLLGEPGRAFLYEEDRPTRRLRTVLEDGDLWPHAPEALRASMGRYDWSAVAPAYDHYLVPTTLSANDSLADPLDGGHPGGGGAGG